MKTSKECISYLHHYKVLQGFMQSDYILLGQKLNYKCLVFLRSSRKFVLLYARCTSE
ncbi:hypothetical protein X777_03285 [Ooceraea biroi]|uniref:Uncharacterized protein n=1 Tax=Ooceraea biroi TaxID=2015173 RepID=A0A026WKP7_OOCBI|nr:hypothetical protein X777_03285 [Ooceraea biroi]